MSLCVYNRVIFLIIFAEYIIFLQTFKSSRIIYRKKMIELWPTIKTHTCFTFTHTLTLTKLFIWSSYKIHCRKSSDFEDESSQARILIKVLAFILIWILNRWYQCSLFSINHTFRYCRPESVPDYTSLTGLLTNKEQTPNGISEDFRNNHK